MSRVFGLIAAGIVLLAAFASSAQDGGIRPQARINERIDHQRLVTLAGNTHPLARAGNDRGAVTGDFPLDHMVLQLARAPQQEQALESLIERQHDPSSPDYHQWLTAEQMGSRFGVAEADMRVIAAWLRTQGFQVNGIAPNQLLIDFSGSAAQVQSAFHTEIHHLEVNGEQHFANVSDPRIPAALSPVVRGIAALHDFRPHRLLKRRTAGAVRRQLTASSTKDYMVPADLATIYNLTPLFNGGTTGHGQTLAVVGDSDLYSTADVTTFQSTFGLSRYGGSFAIRHPSGQITCSDPGIGSDADEATLDVEWALAAAPGASVVLAACKDGALDGVEIALTNLVNSASPPGIISVSYGQCEAELGAAGNYQIYLTAQQAAAEGISLFVASGDANAAACDQTSGQYATHGIGVNGLASTPYGVAVGGTDFEDTYLGKNTTYWSSSNGATYGSALSYVPEVPWNDTCASSLVYAYNKYSVPYGASGFCQYAYNTYYSTFNSLDDEYISLSGGGGGPSGCATGTPSVLSTVGGSCAGYAKPSWQNGTLGNPADAVRDLPDVSAFAAVGSWGHAYVFCYSQTSNGGTSCAGAPSTWARGGGTSFATPIMAGIQALVNQYTGHWQGNPNYVYYKLAATAAASGSLGACNASLGNAVGGSCVFHDVTAGDIDGPCQAGSANCYAPGGNIGALSTTSTLYVPAYNAGVGWDFATGLGSVNAYNLVMAWNSATPTYTVQVTSVGNGSVTSSPGGINCSGTCSGSFQQGQPITLNATPAAGWTFVAWTGACGGSGACQLTLWNNATVMPVFHQASHPALH